MINTQRHKPIQVAIVAALIALGFMSVTPGFADDSHMTTKFEGVKANSGTATHSHQGNKDMLTWSNGFKIPDAPAPHWQVVDSKGNVYLLNRLLIKGGKQNRTITVPAYVPDIAKVQIWCAFAEALLGEASFAKPVKVMGEETQPGMSRTISTQ